MSAMGSESPLDLRPPQSLRALAVRLSHPSSTSTIYKPPKNNTGSTKILMETSSIKGGKNTCGEPELHVLAVDDSSVDRAVISKILRSSKHRVTAVDSGKRALELLGVERNVNMIITDYWMPEMTGFELLKRLKESSELREIPVVIMSSENVPNRISRCLEEGADDFLLKPVRLSDVLRVCSRMMR